MRNIFAITLVLALFQGAYAGSLDSYFKRFEVVKNEEGHTSLVRSKSLMNKFSLKIYLNFILGQIKKEQSLMDSKADYANHVRGLFEQDEKSLSEDKTKEIEYIVDSMLALRDLNVDKIFKDKKFKNIISAYEGKLAEILKIVDPRVLANPTDPKFFLHKKRISEAVKFALKLAKKAFSSVPALNTITYVIVEVEKMILKTREFHQNMLLHYLERHEAKELGMTHEEANKVMSSIYESRIPWFAFWESGLAVANWKKYGVNKFFTEIRSANTRLRHVRDQYDSLGARVNYSFQNATYKGKKVIINVFDRSHRFSKLPAVAYDYSSPKKVARMRTVLQLAGLGISFVPIPGMIKGFVESFIKSFYEKQSLTEGALYAHFESEKNSKMMNQIKAGYLNPFDPVFQ